jgi:hypothetical protein
MLIRMTGLGTLVALLAAGAVAIGGALGADSDGTKASAARTALVIDAAAARDGRDLVDDRLRAIDAELRLPRTLTEARTNLRYFDAQDYRLVVAGPLAAAAADATGIAAVRAPDLRGALAAVGR